MTAVRVLDTLTPELNRIASRLKNTQPLMRVAGGELRDALKAYWRGQGKSIYDRIAKDTELGPITPTSATVVVGAVEGMGPMLLHKRDGGRVKAKTAKALSIPLTPAARKAGFASRFPRPLTLVSRKGKPPLLVEIKGWKRGSWTIHYVLKKSVYHRPDPAALPRWADIEARVLARVRTEFAKYLR